VCSIDDPEWESIAAADESALDSISSMGRFQGDESFKGRVFLGAYHTRDALSENKCSKHFGIIEGDHLRNKKPAILPFT
jgi:hypothetical protein